MFSTERYTTNSTGYNFCGHSGLKLPRLSLGLWHNFGDANDRDEAVKMLVFAFDHGITHFDLANNYGVPMGSAEINFGKTLKSHFAAHRDELLISTKAGHEMWEGPYGNGGTRKSLLASLNQSLRRMQLDYVDIFYSHRYDPETPLEETMDALTTAVTQGKALYVGISKYPPQKAAEAYKILKNNKTPCLVNQYRYNIIDREIEKEILPLIQKEGNGLTVFSPLSQGVLSDKYLNGIPRNARAAKPYANDYLLNLMAQETIEKVKKLGNLADRRGQTLAQMAVAWCLRLKEVTSVIVGTSSVEQLRENINTLNNTQFSDEELAFIDGIF